MNKKLQVFVSSTYTDLIEERQAAVEAILDAGHIPAGMELFKAGNESQLKTIYKWIDESDVYMLILGGRYGTVELQSGKSYTQLEYEYALTRNIPVFAVVLSDSFLTEKINSLGLSNIMEQNEPNKYQSFKSLVLSKTIRKIDDCKDIKISILTTLHDFIDTYNLTGWTKALDKEYNIEEIYSLFRYLNNFQFSDSEKSNANIFFSTYINRYNNGYTKESDPIMYDHYTQLFLKKGLVKTVINNVTNEELIIITDFGLLYYDFISLIYSSKM